MSVKSAQVAVGTTATRLSSDESDRFGGESVAILQNPVAIALGGPTVTWATGGQLPANTPIAIDLQPHEDLYAVTQSGTSTVHVLRTGI